MDLELDLRVFLTYHEQAFNILPLNKKNHWFFAPFTGNILKAAKVGCLYCSIHRMYECAMLTFFLNSISVSILQDESLTTTVVRSYDNMRFKSPNRSKLKHFKIEAVFLKQFTSLGKVYGNMLLINSSTKIYDAPRDDESFSMYFRARPLRKYWLKVL